jgi:steroid delta-isomerase-like uncharacterized protein
MAEPGRRTSDASKELMRQFYEEVVNAGKLDLIDDMLTDDFVEHEEFPGITPNREGVKQFFGMFKMAFPDATFTPEQMIAEGDLIAARVRIRGTHQAEFLGVPASGRSIDVDAIDIVQFRDGVATAHWGVTDAMAMLQQLGGLPEPA